MRRSYLMEYTVLLIICFFSVRACISEKKAITDLKSENTAISDSTVLYKEKYGAERAARVAMVDTTWPGLSGTPDKLTCMLERFYKQTQDTVTSLTLTPVIWYDTLAAARSTALRFRYGNGSLSVSGIIMCSYAIRQPVKDAAMQDLEAAGVWPAPACNSCHEQARKNTGNLQ